MSLFRKAERRGTKIKIAVTGPSGSGKTTGAIRLARGLVGPTGRIAVIDTENRSASLYADLEEFDTCDLLPPYDQAKFAEAIRGAVDAGYDALIIDSFSHVWEAILQYKDQLDRRGGNSFTNWNQAGGKFKEVLEALLHADLHVVACMRSKMDYVIEENAGKKTVRKVGLAPIMRDGIEFEFTAVFDLDMSHQAMTSKDRTRLFDGRIFQLTDEVGEAISRWLDGAAPEDLPAAGTAANPSTETGEKTQPTSASAQQPASPPAQNEGQAPAGGPAPAPKSATADQVKKLREYAATSFGAPLVAQALDKAGQVDVADLTADQAGKTIAWIQGKMNEASEGGYTPPVEKDVESWLTGYTQEVNEYLVKIGWIQRGQSWKDISPERLAKIQTKPENFARAAGIPAPRKEAA